MRVLMVPHLNHFRSEVSGIATVIKNYYRYLPQFGIELVDPDATTYDLKVAHAGMTGADCDVCMLHGLYFSSDYSAPSWEYEVNARIVQAIRHAKVVTVPSSWVAEVFQRDMRFTPHVIGHGVDWQAWQHNEPNEGYILGYGKNRNNTDVCNASFLNALAPHFPYLDFLATFAPKNPTRNITAIGTQPYEEFKRVVQRAAVYISPVKETFGCLTLEALAAGTPVLGVNLGGNRDLVQHGINGYLYEPGNIDDMAEGLAYCIKHRDILGENGREMARAYTWERVIEQVAGVYRLAMEEEPATVSVVIPVYNKTPEQLRRAVESCTNQTYKPQYIMVIDDGSQEELSERYKELNIMPLVRVFRQDNQGVANARNNGIALADSKYICCLDGDDWIEPTFLETCIRELEADRSLGIAYTRLRWHNHETGESEVSAWPGEWNFDNQLKKQNQISTCCVFRREMWARLGGYRQRYAPGGAGAEDAEFWLRAGAYGWGAKLATDEALFNYSLGGSVSANKDYREPDWLSWHPWTKDGKHPFASYATPKKLSHPVSQYDEPAVSVIIPVGPGHERELINALDSLEAQTFRKWEAVVIWDSDTDISDGLFKAYPYCRFFDNGSYFSQWTQKDNGQKDELLNQTRIGGGLLGAGYSRNRGVELARAPLILFLDADDTLHPEAIERMLEKWNATGNAIYTDYVGQAFIDDNFALSLEEKNRLQSFDPKTGEAIIGYQAFDFDCTRALRQPEENSPYIWNLITTLFPKVWHSEIGGFDEEMETWEDWDYWLRMARAGHCFSRLPEQLVRYRFYTGQRRAKAAADTEGGRQTANIMLQYIREKYEGEAVAGCGCKKNGTNASVGAATVAAGSSNVMAMDDDLIRARYLGKGGNHHIIGAHRFKQDPGLPSRRIGEEWVLYYGYKGRGFETYVHKADINAMVGQWMPLAEVRQPETTINPPPVPVVVAARTEPPKPVSKEEAQNRLAAAKAKAKSRVSGEK